MLVIIMGHLSSFEPHTANILEQKRAVNTEMQLFWRHGCVKKAAHPEGSPYQSWKRQQKVGRGVPPSRGMSLIAFLDAALILAAWMENSGWRDGGRRGIEGLSKRIGKDRTHGLARQSG